MHKLKNKTHVLAVACTILDSFLHDRIQWGDEMDLGALPYGKENCIGTAVKQLMREGLLERLTLTRPSKRPGAKGRLVWKYQLANEAKAKEWLTSHGHTPTKRARPVNHLELPLS